MAYFDNYLGDGPDPMDPLGDDETAALNQAMAQFASGDIVGAATTLGPTGLVAAGFVSSGVGAALGAALAVGLALTKLIGRGRQEADIIVPIQNQLINPQGTGQLDQITQTLVRHPNVQGLQALYQQTMAIASAFLDFISNARFTDGRASVQAADTIFPYVNGTCGYTWPPPMKPTQGDCVRWGDGTPGGAGTDGMLGAIARAIVKLGGTIPPPLLTQGMGPYATLQTSSSQTFPWITQSGTIPATAPLSPLRPALVPVLQSGLGDGILPIALLVGVAFMLRRGR